MKKYIVTEGRLKDLLFTEQLLNALLNGGVDNWEWYCESINKFEKENGIYIDDVSEALKEFDMIFENTESLDIAEELYNELDNISRT